MPPLLLSISLIPYIAPFLDDSPSLPPSEFTVITTTTHLIPSQLKIISSPEHHKLRHSPFHYHAMAACGSGGGLSSLFENPPLLPQSNTKQSRPWGLLDPMHPVANDSVLHSPSFSLTSESLQLCTEGLGFESSEDSSSVGEPEEDEEEELKVVRCGSRMRRRSACRVFPPPIPSVGTGGMALVRFHSFKADGRLILKEVPAMVRFHSFKTDGRFILKEVPVANQEHLYAHREDGRLTLRLVQQ